MSCENVQKRISLLLDRQLAPGERSDVLAHLETCRSCASEFASMQDLLATKLKAILDRAEARDYRDIAGMLRHGASLERGLGAFRAMFKGEPATVLRALGWFKDGDLPSLSMEDRSALTAARDGVRDLPQIAIVSRSLR